MNTSSYCSDKRQLLLMLAVNKSKELIEASGTFSVSLPSNIVIRRRVQVNLYRCVSRRFVYRTHEAYDVSFLHFLCDF